MASAENLTEPLVLVAPGWMRPHVEPLLPPQVDARWFQDREEAVRLAPLADIGWLDLFEVGDDSSPALAATKARWLHTTLAGLSKIPVEAVRARGTIVTKGTGITSAAVADYALMGVLTLAKRLDELVRAHDRKEWPTQPPANDALEGTSALIIGYGAIGSRLGARLTACGIAVTGVRRHADPAASIIGMDDWRAQLGAYDWVILAAPGTPETTHMVGAAEFAAMKPGARFINIARGTQVDQAALIAVLRSGHLAGAFLDVTDPEPLPSDDPLWDAPNTLITMHMSGRFSRTQITQAAERFARNVHRFMAGEPLEAQVDLDQGY